VPWPGGSGTALHCRRSYESDVEAFNLLNRTNVSQINAVYGALLTAAPAFGRPIEAGTARQIQFTLDFDF
jgi:hypothetical protein